MAIPYYQPVAPVVPVADNTAAKIVASSDLAGSYMQGFSAMAQMNANRQRMELAQQEFVQSTALEEQKLQLAKEKMAHDFVNDAETLAMQKDLQGAHADYFRSMTSANRDPNNPNGMLGRMRIAQEKAKLISEFRADLQKENLLDPNPKNPVAFYAGARRVDDKYRFARVPEIKSGLAELQQVLDQQTLTVVIGGKFEDGKWKGGKTKQVPAGQIVERLKDPNTAPQMRDTLKRSELLKSDTNTPSFFDKLNLWRQGIKSHDPITTDTLDATVQSYMTMPVDFRRGKARQRDNADANNEAELPTGEVVESGRVPDGSDLFTPTASDKNQEREVVRARAALASGAPREEVLRRFEAKGYSRTLLDE